MTQKLRLLVIDDSSYMVMAIRAMVKLEPSIEIIAEAQNGVEGVEAALALRPDIVTMDVNMPGLNGIEATRKIMMSAPTAIVMLSSMTEHGQAATEQALKAGAVDYIPKSMSAINIDLATITRSVADKIRFWGENSGVMAGGGPMLPPVPAGTDILVMMGGLGSPLAIGAALAGLPVGDVPVLISVDTLSPGLTQSFMDHLARVSSWPIRQATQRGRLMPGQAYVVPGGRAALLMRDAAGLATVLRPGVEEDLTASVVRAADAAQIVLFSGKARGLQGFGAEAQVKPMTLWLQDPLSSTEPALAAAAQALGIPHCILRSKPRASAMAADAA